MNVHAMLNPTPSYEMPGHISSRGVVCDAKYPGSLHPQAKRDYPLHGKLPFQFDGQGRVLGHANGVNVGQYTQYSRLGQGGPASLLGNVAGMPQSGSAARINEAFSKLAPCQITDQPAGRGESSRPRNNSGPIPCAVVASQLPESDGFVPAVSGAKRSGSPSTSFGLGKIELGLARMQAIMKFLPPLRIPAIHLAGTNGKGSVSALIESCLRAAGLRTARYNSPHLIEPRDALRLNGVAPTRVVFAAALKYIQDISNFYHLNATTFEITTAAAYHIIIQYQPDVMIIECGMGGAGDATNVIPDDVTLASALTSVGMDHTAFLGNSVAAITEQKASIAVAGGLLFVAPQTHPDVITVAQRVASERGASVLEIRPSTEIYQEDKGKMSLRPFRPPVSTLAITPLPSHRALEQTCISSRLSLPGLHQLDNLSIALSILHVLRQDRRCLVIQPKLAQISDRTLETGVSSAQWPGRCSWVQWTDPSTRQNLPILVDGAHNADSARRLRQYIDSLVIEPRRPVTFIISLSNSQGKTVESVLGPLLKPGDSVAAIAFSTPVEGMPWVSSVSNDAVSDSALSLVEERGKVWVGEGNGKQAVRDALRWATADWDEKGPGLVVVCGSLYLVADVYRLTGP